MSRYDNHALGSKPIRDLLNLLEHGGLLDLRYPRARRGEVSSIAPSAMFAHAVHELGVTLSDFGRDDSEELILLTRNSRRLGATLDDPVKHERIEYRDTAETLKYRREVRRLNSFLADADLTFIDDALEPTVDQFSRSLRRHFTVLPSQAPRFDQNGRLFGGWWQTLKSRRRENIRINGEAVATLDYSAMFTRLAYAYLGRRAPEGDPYNLPGAKGYRSGIKRAMNILLFDHTTRRKSWPAQIGVGVGTDYDAVAKPEGRAAQFEGRLPAGWTVAKTKRAILHKHPLLEEAWGHALGYHLMFEESRVLLAALNILIGQKVPALGLHDGLLVQVSRAAVAKKAMEDAAWNVVGTALPVTVESPLPSLRVL
jgi:hypothetical protein